MMSFDGILFLLFLWGGLISIALILAFIIKVKRGWLWLIMLSVVGLGIYFFYGFAVDRPFHRFEADLCQDYPEIGQVELSTYNDGGQYNLLISLKTEINPEQTERIFKAIVKRMNQDPMPEYFKKRDRTRWMKVRILFLEIPNGEFRSESYLREKWFTEEPRKEQIWENADNLKKYIYDDEMW